MTTLSAAIRYRKNPDTPVPTMLVTLCRPELPFFTWSSKERIPKFKSTAMTNTIDECPREKKKPTLSGRLPSLMSLRVVLSIAAMWSASNAWRMPSVKARIPVPNPNTSLDDRW